MKDGKEKCKCIDCGKVYGCQPAGGTSHLLRHIPKCPLISKSMDAGKLRTGKLDQKAYRDALAKCIIMHDLPFSYAEFKGVWGVNKVLNPEFKPVCRNTAKADCWKTYLIEKTKLKTKLSNIPSKVCLTSDVWSSITTQGYMTVTAHFVDDNWKLNSKLLAFCELDSSHTGLELSGKAFEVLKDWGIDTKIFSLTLDNAASNDSMQNLLKERLELQNGLLCNSEFFHIRCCAHILNLIVQEGLKVASEALYKIRESIKYVKASEGRLKQFKRCIQEVYLDDMGSFLRLDVSIRWNATYMMLESAIKYRRAFTSLTYNDRNYKHCPSTEEWERAEKMCAFLAPFYQITNLISGSSYPTSNLYFMQVYTIEMKLNQNLNSEDEVIKDMVTRMKIKFDKYWSDYCVVLALGCVLDPRTKLKFLSFCYKRMYPNNYQDKVDRVKNALYALFSEYLKSGTSNSNASHDMSHMTQSSPHEPMIVGGNRTSSLPSIYEEFEEEMSQENRNNDKSQLDTYLEAKIVGNDKDFDVLQYWKMNKYRFPDLAIMACDILSIPITTVASESTFSIGGRILNKYRSCLLPKNVQALICTRNWVHGFEEIEPSDVDGSILDDTTFSDSNIIPDDDDGFIDS